MGYTSPQPSGVTIQVYLIRQGEPRRLVPLNTNHVRALTRQRRGAAALAQQIAQPG